MADLKPVIEQVKATLAETKEKLADNGGWDAGDFKDVYEAIVSVAVEVEAAADEFGGLTESEKKEAIVQTLNWMIDLPWMTEAMEGMALELVVGLIWQFVKNKLDKPE